MSVSSSRTIVIIGFVAMLIGTLDPLEGSVVILAGLALIAVGAFLGHSIHRRMSYVALAFAALGVGLLWGVSAIGGLGGSTGRSLWWALLLLPYPVGWMVGLVVAVRLLREKPQAPPRHA